MTAKEAEKEEVKQMTERTARNLEDFQQVSGQLMDVIAR